MRVKKKRVERERVRVKKKRVERVRDSREDVRV